MPILTLPVCTRLGPYEIVSAIGAEGMGDGYKASESRLDRIVASHLASAQHYIHASGPIYPANLPNFVQRRPPVD